jgi:protein O-GlcNAc transferase
MNARQLEANAVWLRRNGREAESIELLESLLAQQPDAAWIHAQLGACLENRNRPAAIRHFERALDLDPDRLDYRMALVQALARRMGDGEGEMLERARGLLLACLDRVAEFTADHVYVADEVFSRTCDYGPRDLLHLAWLASRSSARG